MERTSRHRVTWGPLTAVCGSLLLFFGSQLAVGLIVGVVLLGLGYSDAEIDTWFIGGNQQRFFLSTLIAALTVGALFWYLSLRKAHPHDIGLVKPKASDLGYVLGGAVAYIALYVVLVGFISSVIPALNTEQTQELGFSKEGPSNELVLIFISLVVLPPLVEEIVVRGFMFTGLRTKFSFWTAAVISSGLFGLAHLLGGEGGSAIWIATIDTFILGMVLAYLREKTGSLWPAIGLHALKNLVAFTFLFVLKG